MHYDIEQLLGKIVNTFKGNAFAGSLVGLEKESLRVNAQGTLSQQPHPKSLGSALTHPYITTDYSEALLEFITPAVDSPLAALQFLQRSQRFVYSQLDNEVLWANSMPCVLGSDDSIPIAEYGSSNAGIMKTVYRRGLGHRYGRMMQVIAGVHYNYSLPQSFWPQYQFLLQDNTPLQDFVSAQYFGMIRNLQRFAWLIPFLFGASPAVCRTFMDGIEQFLQPFDEYTYYEPYATSIRVGDIGYQNYKEDKTGIKANYNSLAEYINSLRQAIETPCKIYEAYGIKLDGVYQQLNANLLQIENEYYSSVRPKQLTGTYEKPVVALQKRGVRYVELRSLDLNIYQPEGITLQQLYFLEVFVLFCLLQDSPAINSNERKAIDKNLNLSAHQGRDPQLSLNCNDKTRLLTDWAQALLEAMKPVAHTLDQGNSDNLYVASLQEQSAKIEDSSLTPSARILAEMRELGESFFPFSMRYAQKHASHYRNTPLDESLKAQYQEMARESLQKQQQLEDSDTMDFDHFLQAYFDETL